MMPPDICTEILKALNDDPTGSMDLQELVQIVNPELSFSAELSDSRTYKKIQEMIILENIALLRDQGLVLLKEQNEIRLAVPGVYKK
ncbi:MAG: hypothetical protein EOO20_00740 [Chryseobacterium sp.]|nr:MAG: hypothetical protein EOO20_00740 [Chryseobacterium sp.]